MNNATTRKRMGVVSIIISDRKRDATAVNEILTTHGELILARMGLPCPERGLAVIALIVEASTDEIGSLTGRLGWLESVTVKASLV